MPHSLGLLYERVTEYLGFLHSSDEYKVMALASYGKPRHLGEFRDMVRLGANGQYTIAPLRLEERFGPARLRGGPMEQRHFDIAKSLQVVLEETVLELARWLHGASRRRPLHGGRGRPELRDERPAPRPWTIPPDLGPARRRRRRDGMGAALWIDARERGTDSGPGRWTTPSSGRPTRTSEIEDFLRWSKLPYRRLANVPAETADILVRTK